MAVDSVRVTPKYCPADYVQRLEAFTDQHRERLQELLRAYGPGSAPAEHGRYALVGQPESLVICERLESTPSLPIGVWSEEFPDALRTTSTSGGDPDTASAGEQGSRGGTGWLCGGVGGASCSMFMRNDSAPSAPRRRRSCPASWTVPFPDGVGRFRRRSAVRLSFEL
ncbi:hypothetical protein [Streptomyces sp. NBC_01589]|uniref:hypothetical protein n=1 Tax=unclassified Streptomyces TaxID=2593676 RepID=UPI003868FCD9